MRLFLFLLILTYSQAQIIDNIWRFKANYDYVQSTLNLPPTYSYEKYGIKQVVPDPITYFELSMKLTAQKQAEENAKFWANKK
jgi:hypothetical protein